MTLGAFLGRPCTLGTAAVLVAASTASCVGGAGSAEPTAADCKSYPDDDITMVIGRSPGGGYDEYGRFMAPLLEKELGQTIVIENVDGAGGAVAASQVQQAEADGYTIHLTEPNGLGALQVVDEVEYDLTKFTMLGTVNNRDSTFAVAADSGIQSFDELASAGRGRTLTMATTGLTSPNFVNGVIAAQQAGFEVSPVAHESSSDAITSVVRGDTDFTVFSEDTIAEGVHEGDLKALVQFGEEPYRDLRGVPLATSIGMGELSGELMSTLVLVAPPGLPGCIKKPLTTAVQNVLHGEEMAKFGAEGHIVEPGTPAEARQAVADALSTYKQYADSYGDVVAD